jgi:hypothetical protein
MSEPIPFLSPRLVGKRFEGHAVPLEVLKDLAALDELIKETAKWHFLQSNPGRQRVPRGFTDEISLRVQDIEPGSAIPLIMLYVVGSQLLFSDHQKYFERARDSVIAAIDVADSNGRITDHLPETILPHFDTLGRSLLDDESIEFRPENPERPARLNKVVRRRLILASSQAQEVTEEVVLRGTVPEADHERKSFELQVIHGPKLAAPIEPFHLETIVEAFTGYQQSVRVSVRGVVKYDRGGRPKRIERVEEVNILDPNDVLARLDELRMLQDGWLDGAGAAPSVEGLAWFAQEFEANYPRDAVLPYVYPTAEGGLQLEWGLPAGEVSLEIDLVTKQAEWHRLNLSSSEEAAFSLDLGQAEFWEVLAQEVRNAGGTVA